jgi:hypothetical protein
MSEQWISRRVAAVKAADAINAIEGAPVSDYAKNLSYLWAKGDLSGDQMRDALLISHRAIAQRLCDHG